MRTAGNPGFGVTVASVISVVMLLAAAACEDGTVTDGASSGTGTMYSEGGFDSGTEDYTIAGDNLHIENSTLTFRSFTYDLASASVVNASYEDSHAKIWVDGALVYED